MKNIFVLLLCASFSNFANAGYDGGTVKRVYTTASGWTYFGLADKSPAGTCSNWGEHFKFDSTTPGGKNMFAIILAAKASGKTINVWYGESTKAGSDQSSGCTGEYLSTLQNVGIK